MGRGIGLVSSLSLSEEKVKDEFTDNNQNINFQIINLSLTLSCPVVPNTRNETMGHSSINVSLTYLRGLEIPELNEEDMPMI